MSKLIPDNIANPLIAKLKAEEQKRVQAPSPYKCDRCQDTGIYDDVAGNHGGEDDGGVISVTCSCIYADAN